MYNYSTKTINIGLYFTKNTSSISFIVDNSVVDSYKIIDSKAVLFQ